MCFYILNNHTTFKCCLAVVAMASDNMPQPDFSRPPPVEFSQPPPEFSRPPPEFPRAPLPDFSQPPPVLQRQPVAPRDFPPPVAVMRSPDWDGVSPREQCPQQMRGPPSSNNHQMGAPKRHMGGDVYHDHDDQGSHARGSIMGPRDIPLDHDTRPGDPQECPRDPRERDPWDSDSADDQRSDGRKYDRRRRSDSRDRDYMRGRHDGRDRAGLQSPPLGRRRPVSPSSNVRSVSKSPDRPATPRSESSHKSHARSGDAEPGTVQLQII